MIREPIIIDESGSVELFATVNDAEMDLEAIDVHDGIFVAHARWGQVLRLSTWKDERGIELVKIEGTSEYQPEELSRKLYAFLIYLKKLPEKPAAMSLGELVDCCTREGLVTGFREQKRRRRFPVMVIAAVIIFAASGAILVRALDEGRPFDAAAWKNPIHDTDHVRAEMCDYLIAKKLLTGKTRAEIVAMLGEPPETEYFSEYDLVYWLGPERGFFGIDSEWLVMRFDAAGRVADCELVTD